ncbi:uncharacterized protein CELE_W01C8.1 [Caenorhabditis elegans]|uniref:Uncharacterized protein n=1 Tax=Caenorhabditis elegans TaxID=6239 RepID=Q9GYG6_CAEEL|nr:Uncharacterized protein CELE_W01C8.1 [Caenorhabditis elegans]CCD68672.1 Uncharacterized protein CELE_W01C8.1 [Caenorhabditis elegans]|eukprot:NP_508958.2 Uncharacterized protein CELE_W01C8.1 [Caenorhabditis elegans]
MGSSNFQFGSADYSKQWLHTSTYSVTEMNTNMLHNIKTFGQLLKLFSEKFGGHPEEKRLPPMILFVKNYLRHYSIALIDQTIDLESSNSFSTNENTMESLIESFRKLYESYMSVFQEDQISQYANLALQELMNEKHTL